MMLFGIWQLNRYAFPKVWIQRIQPLSLFNELKRRNVFRVGVAYAVAVIWGFANDTDRLPRQSHDEVQALIDGTDLEQ